MQDDPIERSRDGDPQLNHSHQLKRWLLLELVACPPAEGDDLEYLTPCAQRAALARRGCS